MAQHSSTIRVRTLLKLGDDFVPIASLEATVQDELYIDGAIELELKCLRPRLWNKGTPPGGAAPRWP